MLHKIKSKGFSLLEMMLVMVIMGVILAMVIGFMQQKTQQIRVDKTTAQMQQLLNIGLTYYVSNGSWPTNQSNVTNLSFLTPAYLPSSLLNGSGAWVAPTLSPYAIYSYKGYFYAFVQVGPSAATAQSLADARMIAGQLPMAYTTSSWPPTYLQAASTPAACSMGSACLVVAAVNIPGQNLNNATAINYAGIYKHGACVPVPQCPVDQNGNTMTPEIVVVPVGMAGNNDNGSPNIYPISSFTAYAEGPSALPLAGCSNPGWSDNCGISPVPTTQFWRACLQVVTPKGDVASTNASWSNNAYLAAFTRCAISNESRGSPFTYTTR